MKITARVLAPALLQLLLVAAPAVAGEPATDAGGFATGRLVAGVACLKDPTQTYTLYLPSSYAPERRWPVLLIFDPRGRSELAAELFRPAAEEYGWILVSSDDTRSDGPPEPNVRAVNALWPEPHERFSVDPRRIYATGFSGGAILAWTLANSTHAVAGVIGAGGRLAPEVPLKDGAFAHFGTVGDIDFNYREMRDLDAALAANGNPHRLEVFHGPHTWMPEELATLAVEWMEIQAMKRGTRPADAELARRLLEEDLAAAAQREAAGDPLAAARRLDNALATFEGVVENDALEPARRRRAALEADPLLGRASAEEASWDAYEERYAAEKLPLLALARDPAVQIPANRLLAELEIRQLRERARQDSYAGTVARRLLETLHTQTSFYLARELLGQKRYRQAEAVLTVAVEIHDDRPASWYNLACASARAGHEKRAMEALERAVAAGFNDAAHLGSDPDLASLRGREDFRRLLARLGGASPAD